MSLKETGLFLDRDGTINVEVEYLWEPDKVELIPGAADAIRSANETGIRVFVITNQSGVARGLYSEADVIAVHHRIQEMLSRQGARVDAFYYCPHHPEFGNGPYTKVCTCRKPDTGMLKDAEKAFGINLASSFVVGDKCTDIEAGKNAGAGTVLVLTGFGRAEVDDCNPDHVAENLSDAWNFIKNELKSRKRDPS